jgi:hypothetical protein
MSRCWILLAVGLALAACRFGYGSDSCPDGSDCSTVAVPGAALVLVAATPVGDSNGDGALSPGESAGMRVKIRNAGTVDLSDLTGTLSTEMDGITIAQGESLWFGNLRKGDTACGHRTRDDSPGTCYSGASDYPRVTVDQGVAPGTTVPFVLTLTDGREARFRVDFPLVVTAIDQGFRVTRATVLGDTNGDGELSPGETGALRVEVKNLGGSKALGVTGTLTAADPRVAVATWTILRFGDLGPGEVACGPKESSGAEGSCYTSPANYPRVTLDPSIPAGTTLVFTLDLVDVYQNRFSLPFTLVAPPIDQAFAVTQVTVLGDQSRSGALGPGEEAELRVEVANLGGARAVGIVGDLTSDEAGVVIAGGSGVAFGEIRGGETACGHRATSSSPGACYSGTGYYPRVTLPATRPPAPLTLRLGLVDAYGNRFPLTFWVPVE